MKKIFIPLLALLFLLGGCSLGADNLKQYLGGLLKNEEQDLVKQPVASTTNNNASKPSDGIVIHSPDNGDGTMASYGNGEFHYSLLYPKVWNVQSFETSQTLANGKLVTFSYYREPVIQLFYTSSNNSGGISDWYKINEHSTTSLDIISKNGWEGFFFNKKTFYLMGSDKSVVYELHFTPLDGNDLNRYYDDFLLMIDSFKFDK
jgi:hypothetical protein